MSQQAGEMPGSILQSGAHGTIEPPHKGCGGSMDGQHLTD